MSSEAAIRGSEYQSPSDMKVVSANPDRVLVVDDEESIRHLLEDILRDEGFETYSAGDGASALSLIAGSKPACILLDIWMPGMDGIEVLERVRQSYPDVPVIMMSGHATIASAVKATQLGAVNFIEKPLELEATVRAVRQALGLSSSADAGIQAAERDSIEVSASQSGEVQIGRVWDPSSLQRVVFSSQALRGRAVVQRTLKHSALLYGQGLHSGTRSGLIFEPLPPNSGIHFSGLSPKDVVPAHVDFVKSTGFATTIQLGGTQAATIEHVMSALHAFGISNLLVKCNGEVPVMDGSAREFCRLFREIGMQEQPGEWYEIEIRERISVGNDREYITLEPAGEFSIDYTLEYPQPVGLQRMVFTLRSTEEYEKEIAPARTFGFVKDVGMLQKQGLALGGRFDNFVLIGEEGAINDSLRYANEPVRHKILDALGDLYLLGRPIRGRVTARMTGHSDNIDLLREVRRFLELEPA